MNEDICYKETIIVECIYNKTKCPDDGIFSCGNIQIFGDLDDRGCGRFIISWSTYLIYKKYLKEVKTKWTMKE